jgi:3-hydroxyisobutyrate dehydrogenase-like beta-hydroxyacid dehydrogenase
MSTIGLLSPGQMGASVGAAATYSGATVVWAGEGRSDASRQRAEKAGLEDCGSIETLVSSSDIILSVCPPHDAMDIAGKVAGLGFSGVFLEGNAIAPQKTRQIDQLMLAAGANLVDGGIVGGPAWKAESGTMLYLSGDRGDEIAALFSSSPLHTTVISDRIGAASAMKMVFAAYTKGSTALLTAILGVAEAEGVRQTLETQWGDAFTTQTHQRLTANSAKAWRFAGEMREIAATFENAGFPPGFHEGAAEVFEKLVGFKDDPATDINALVSTLLKKP